MKVIDLLNKIANGEKVPKRIRVDRINYIFDEIERFYHRDNEPKEDLLALGEDYSTWDFLNWNVETIEDQTIDIDSMVEVKLIQKNYLDMDKNELTDEINKNRVTINKLVQAVKHLNKEIQSIKERM